MYLSLSLSLSPSDYQSLQSLHNKESSQHLSLVHSLVDNITGLTSSYTSLTGKVNDLKNTVEEIKLLRQTDDTAQVSLRKIIKLTLTTPLIDCQFNHNHTPNYLWPHTPIIYDHTFYFLTTLPIFIMSNLPIIIRELVIIINL